jgi:hypothetical protein
VLVRASLPSSWASAIGTSSSWSESIACDRRAGERATVKSLGLGGWVDACSHNDNVMITENVRDQCLLRPAAALLDFARITT